MSCTVLPGLTVLLVFAAVRAVLEQFESIGVIAAVLAAHVSPAPAIRAFERDNEAIALFRHENLLPMLCRESADHDRT